MAQGLEHTNLSHRREHFNEPTWKTFLVTQGRKRYGRYSFFSMFPSDDDENQAGSWALASKHRSDDFNSNHKINQSVLVLIVPT